MNTIRAAHHRSGTSLAKIYDFVVKALQEGELVPGQYLPSLRDLADQFQVSRAPVHQAILRLEREGLVRRLHGRGVEVLRSVSVREKDRRKPLVQVITPLIRVGLAQPPSSMLSHHIMAVDEWLLWYLGHEQLVRMQAAFWRDEEDFLSRLEECLQNPPGVVVFAKPEELSRDAIHLLQRLVREGVAVVHATGRMEVEGLDCVRPDFVQGQYDLTRRVIASGRRRLLRLQLPGGWNFEARKESGYRLALQEAPSCQGFTLEVRMRMGYVHETDLPELKALLADALGRLELDAVLAINDVHAAMVQIVLEELGVHDVVVTGYDAVWKEMQWEEFFVANPDHARSAYAWPAPLSVDTRLPEVALALARLAVNRALGKLPPFPQMTLLPVTVVEAGDLPASAPLPSGDFRPVDDPNGTPVAAHFAADSNARSSI